MKKILMIGTGGTIASKISDDGLVPGLSANELLSYVPDAASFCEADSLQIMNIDSTNMQPEHWLSIAKTIEDNYDRYDGFVVCHGTDTLAYTAAALSYLIQYSPKPIVVTGAQRPINLDITDARANLLDSLRFAACDKAYNVNIVFDGKVIAGTRGKKERTKSYDAFASINFPYLAVIQDEHIIFYVSDKEQAVNVNMRPVFYHTLNSNITLLKLIPSMDADLLDYMARRYDAVIIEAFGVGGLPNYGTNNFRDAIRTWTELGKTVIMTTQVAEEGSNMSVYEVGHGIKKEFGLLEAYDMTLEATVTKLMWILGQTKDACRIRDLYYHTINRDVLWH